MQDNAQDMLNALADHPMDPQAAAIIEKQDAMAQQTSGLIMPTEKKLVHADMTLVDPQGNPLKAEAPAVEPKYPLPSTWSKLLARKKELTDAMNKVLPEGTTIKFNSQTPDILPTFWNPKGEAVVVSQATMDLTLEYINWEGVYRFFERIGALPYLSGAQLTGFDKDGYPIVKLAPDQAAKLKKRNMDKAKARTVKAANLRANAPRSQSKDQKKIKRKLVKASRKKNRG